MKSLQGYSKTKSGPGAQFRTYSGPFLALWSGSGPSPEFRTFLVPLFLLLFLWHGVINHLLVVSGRTICIYQQLFKCDTTIRLWAACSKNQSRNRSEISRVSSFKRFWGDALASRITRPAVLTNTSLIAFINLVTINPYVLRVDIGIYSIYPGLPIQDLDFGITTIAKFRPLGQDQDFFQTILG